MAKTVERRYYKIGQETDLRANRADDGASPTLRGHAAVFDSLSVDLGGFREIIAPGAFSSALERGDDTAALWNHDVNHVLGRSRSGTLRMEEDEVGLAVEIDMPETSTGQEVYELVRRGDVDQMSFGFYVLADRWEKRDGENVRIVEDVELFDVSPVTFPAYAATDLAVRSLPAESRAKLDELEVDDNSSEAEASDNGNGEEAIAPDPDTSQFDLKRKKIELLETEL